MAEPTLIEFWCAYGGKHPVVGDVWYRFAKALGYDADRYDRYMCAALTMMVHTPSECSEVIELIDVVATGKSQEESWGLNDTCVTFRANEAQVDILIEDELGTAAGRFSLEVYRKVVTAWRQFLLMPEGPESRLQLELP